MTKDDLPFEYRKIPETKSRKTESKKIQNPYAEKYMEDKKRVVIKESISQRLRQVKNKRRLNSDNETINFLLNLEKDLSKMNMIKEFAKCPDCGAKMSAEHIKKVHNHVDSNFECFGCLQKDYEITLTEEDAKTVAKMQEEQKKEQEEQNEQTDTSEQEDNDEEVETQVKVTRKLDAMDLDNTLYND
jgi:hypothetical protein